MKYSLEDKQLLEKYVSNVDKSVYAIYNLPEEVIAVVFAYVSRSPDSFRDNLLKLLKDDSLNLGLVDGVDLYDSSAQEEASKFHEKWVIQYGHSSVAEHATAHLGIEGISRLASAELELSNTFLSFTEYSQRYQRPERNKFVIPKELATANLKELFVDTIRYTFDRYEELQEALYEYLLDTRKPREGESEKYFRNRMEKLSFEDARYALTLATKTNLGMTGNGRAIRDSLTSLLTYPQKEIQDMAIQITEEAEKVLPSLLRYVKPNSHELDSHKMAQISVSRVPEKRERAEKVKLLKYTPQDEALDDILFAFLTNKRIHTPTEIKDHLKGMSYEEKESLFRDITGTLDEHQLPIAAYKATSYRFLFNISEANWHQLLRHSRKINFFPQRPNIYSGVTVPPSIQEAGLEGILYQAVDRAEEAYKVIYPFSPVASEYVVTNAHNRHVMADLDLRQVIHLVRSRTTPHAQWDIKDTVRQMSREIKAVHSFWSFTD